MLISLSIKNYALIDDLQVNFNQGLSIITGETGAGKSILLGGLSLILGKRADLGILKNNDRKCIIEAVFDVSTYQLEAIYKNLEFDFEEQTIIRREILPSGKSRAFVNDSPVNLNNLQSLGKHLIDIHSQHETLQLVDDDFQFRVIDALAKNDLLLSKYTSSLKKYKLLQEDYNKLLKFQTEAIKEHDYNSFLLKELEEAHLTEGQLKDLEIQFETLNNAEEIKETLESANFLMNDEQIGSINNLMALRNNFQRLSNYAPSYLEIYNRLNETVIDLNDIYQDIVSLSENLDVDSDSLLKIENRIDLITSLMKKHFVNSELELIEIKKQLKEKIELTENLDEDLLKLEKELKYSFDELNIISNDIHSNRNKIIPILTSELKKILNQLGMSNAEFNINVNQSDRFYLNGKDILNFKFKANKGGKFNDLKKAASGGELSRIMLAIKLILSNYVKLPSIIFDEIDSGVSGEISNKMGDIMLEMSKSMQVLTITHLPQIAAKGHTHFKVYKEDVGKFTHTNLQKLDHDERIIEIAQMLGGVKISNSAMAHAKQLLN